MNGSAGGSVAGTDGSVAGRWARAVGRPVMGLQRRAVHDAHAGLLHVFARLPVGLRRVVARRMGVGYTVGALVLVEEGERLLLIRPSYRRAWGLPGGLLRRREEPAVGAAREVREELGVRVEVLGGAVAVFDVIARRIDVVYRARLAPGEEPVATSAEVRELGWFTRSGLPELLPEAESALEALDREGEGLLVLPPDGASGWLT